MRTWWLCIMSTSVCTKSGCTRAVVDILLALQHQPETYLYTCAVSVPEDHTPRLPHMCSRNGPVRHMACQLNCRVSRLPVLLPLLSRRLPNIVYNCRCPKPRCFDSG